MVLPTTVWLVIAEPLLRVGMNAHLTGNGFETTVERASIEEMMCAGDQAVRPPDLIVVGVACGADAIAMLKKAQPQARIVILGESVDLHSLADAFGAGAQGYLLKSIGPSALIESLRLVMIGERVFPSRMTDFLGQIRAAQQVVDERVQVGEVVLSRREVEIVQQIANGSSNKEIAALLRVAEATVKVHVKRLLRKIGASNRTQIATWALQHNVTLDAESPPNGSVRAG